MPISDRNEAANLVLLCQDCHTTVDHNMALHEFPEEALLAMKHEHEERIHHLTAMARDRETTVLRVFGSVRGSIPEMTRDIAIQTVYAADGRYARFPLTVDKHGIEIDLTPLPDPEVVGEGYWAMGKAMIDKDAKRVSEAVRGKHVRHLSVFALARIPLLVYLGYVLDDKVPTEIYQKQRGGEEGWGWPEERGVAFESKLLREGDFERGVGLLLSLSGSAGADELPAEVEGMPVYEIRPVRETPNPNLFRSRSTLDAFVRCYQDFLAELEARHKSAPAIHLLPISPIAASIACGRHLMRDVHPEMRVYDRVGKEFKAALTVNDR